MIPSIVDSTTDNSDRWSLVQFCGCRVVTWFDERFSDLVLVQVKVLDFVKVDHIKWFIIAVVTICSCSRVKHSWSTDEDSSGKPLIVDSFAENWRPSSVVLWRRRTDISILFIILSNPFCRDPFECWLREKHQGVTSQNRPLIGYYCRHFHFQKNYLIRL